MRRLSALRPRHVTVALSAIVAVFLCLQAPCAIAQAWPMRQPIKIVVPFPPGGAADLTARLLAARLSELNGQSVYVENHAGANGIIGLEFVARSAADGYTLLDSNLSSHGTGPAVYKKLPYDPVKDFAPIVQVNSTPMLLVANPALPYRSVQDVIAAAKLRPGKVTIASAGNGSSTHLAAELFGEMAGIKLLHVPYKGDTPAMVDVASGVVDLLLVSSEASESLVKSGRLRPLATGGAKRLATMPALPTIAESGVPGYVGATWSGLLAPAGTPQAVVDSLNRQVNDILKSRDFRDRLESAGSQVVGGTAADFGNLIQSEIAKWVKVAQDNHIALD